MSLAVPTWVAAIATAVLAVGVIVAVGLARKALSAHLQQFAAQHELTAQLAQALELQSQHLRQALDERRRAQACQVFIELNRIGAHAPPDLEAPARHSQGTAPGPWRVAATVHNNSQQPVYDVYVIWLLGTTRMGRPDPAARLLPGQEVAFERGPDDAAAAGSPPGTQVDPSTLTAFLTFRDTAGVRWTVREDGTLSDISPVPESRAAHD
jgi:hypothetical protein